jgi:hypothetical protein
VAETDDLVAVASERAALTTVLGLEPAQVKPIEPGHVIVIKRDGTVRTEPFCQPGPRRECAFERIYFSRGNDPDIYEERKSLGRELAPRVMQALNGDAENAVFGFIPNTSETAYIGLVDEMGRQMRLARGKQLTERLAAGKLTATELEQALTLSVRAEKVARVARDIPPTEIYGDTTGDLLILGWGSTYGSIRSAVERLQSRGKRVSHAHLRYLNPLPSDLGEMLKNFKHVLMPELNAGQLRMLIRAKYLVDAVGFNLVRGKPFQIGEIEAKAESLLGESVEAAK